MNVIPFDSFTTTRWKNGGGVTHEAIRVPAHGDPFLWRVSVAEIESSGPFSDFVGYQRKMAMLRGNGITLTFGDGARRELREPGDWVEFDGGLSTRCELFGGTCTDLNLMVRNGIRAQISVQSISEAWTFAVASGTTGLIFPIDAPLWVRGTGRDAVELGAWDLGVVVQNAAGNATPSVTVKTVAPNRVFLATMYLE